MRNIHAPTAPNTSPQNPFPKSKNILYGGEGLWQMVRSKLRHDNEENINATPDDILGLWKSANGPETTPMKNKTSPTYMMIFGTTGKPLRMSRNPKGLAPPLTFGMWTQSYHGPRVPGFRRLLRGDIADAVARKSARISRVRNARKSDYRAADRTTAHT